MRRRCGTCPSRAVMKSRGFSSIFWVAPPTSGRRLISSLLSVDIEEDSANRTNKRVVSFFENTTVDQEMRERLAEHIKIC